MSTLLALALPYYERGRQGDTQHIRWIVRRLKTLEPRIRQPGYDFEMIYALAVLHDIGYSQLEPGYDPFSLKIRRQHQIESARLARQLLADAGFPKEKAAKTVYLIRHHDDWACGKPLRDPEWRVFADLDFSWEASPQGYDIVRRFLRQTRREFLRTVQTHYSNKTPPFLLPEAKRLFLADLKARRRIAKKS